MNYPLRLVGDWTVVAITMIAAAFLGWWSWWPAALIIGSRQHAMAEIGHMAMHGRRKVLAFVAFSPLGIDWTCYRDKHLAHHRAISDPVLDPEMVIQNKYKDRWETHRTRDLWLDAVGLHADEMFDIFRDLSSVKSIAVNTTLVLAAWFVFGPIVLLWPAATLTGAMLAQRLRARTEHQHYRKPGQTLLTENPALWRRAWYLPHGTWHHNAHHGVRYAAK